MRVKRRHAGLDPSIHYCCRVALGNSLLQWIPASAGMGVGMDSCFRRNGSRSVRRSGGRRYPRHHAGLDPASSLIMSRCPGQLDCSNGFLLPQEWEWEWIPAFAGMVVGVVRYQMASSAFLHPVRRRFGQHFLVDETVVERIIRAIDPRPGERIVEIGPGKGALTIPLLSSIGRLDVVEVDRDLAADLEREMHGHAGSLNLVREDALRLDFTRFPAERLKVVGNLPYNISTPLLFHLLQFDRISVMVFMLQKEVVDRLCARADTPRIRPPQRHGAGPLPYGKTV